MSPPADRSPDLRPRTVGEILDAAFVLARHRFGALLFVCTVVSLPTLAVAVWLSAGFDEAMRGTVAGVQDYMDALQRNRGQWNKEVLDRYMDVLVTSQSLNIYVYVGALAQSLARAGACVAGAAVATAAIRGEPQPGIRSLLWTTLRRLPGPAVLWTFGLLFNATCGICIPLAILAYTLIAPCSAAALEMGPRERAVGGWGLAPWRWIVRPFASAIDAAARGCPLSFHAMTLVRGSFAISVILIFLAAIVGVVSLLVSVLWKSLGAWYVVQHFAEVVLLPVLGTTSALWYLDMRIRREGIDLEPAAS